MRLIICLTVALALALSVSGEQQRILRRVIKSTPTATNLARIRLVTVRSASAEKGAVAEISSKEAANFGQRSSNETTTSQQATVGLKSKPTTSNPAQSPSTTTTTTTAPTTTSAPPTTTNTVNAPSTTLKPEQKPKASDRQHTGPQSAAEVELLSSAPSSWQTMTAVEAPAAMLIATGTRAAASSRGDLSQSSSTLHSSEESISSGDFLRSSASPSVKGASSYTRQSVGETFARLRQQQQSGTKQAQQYFYPPQQVKAAPSKTSPYQATKTHWYQPPTPAATPRPAPIIQEQQYEQQQSEQYVEQQVEYGAAPLGQAEPFAFDFKTEDNSGNGQYRKEESDKNGVVRGSYGYTDASGIYRHVEYVADQNGFRANIKSNEPGLIGETQPASIQMAGGAGSESQRLSASFDSSSSSSNSGDNGEWIATSASNDQGSSSADLALAPPDFESSHKSEHLRAPRHFRN